MSASCFVFSRAFADLESWTLWHDVQATLRRACMPIWYVLWLLFSWQVRQVSLICCDDSFFMDGGVALPPDVWAVTCSATPVWQLAHASSSVACLVCWNFGLVALVVTGFAVGGGPRCRRCRRLRIRRGTGERERQPQHRQSETGIAHEGTPVRESNPGANTPRVPTRGRNERTDGDEKCMQMDFGQRGRFGGGPTRGNRESKGILLRSVENVKI